MEYLGLSASYFGTAYLSSKINTTIPVRVLSIIVGMVIFTIIFNSIRAYRVCDQTNTNRTATGAGKGALLSIFAVIIGIIFFIWFVSSTTLVSIASIFFPFLSEGSDIVKGLLVALTGTLGYWIGRIFIGIC